MKNITINLNEISAQIVADTLEFYNLCMLEEAERRDPFKDNSPYINAIKDFLNAYKTAKQETKKAVFLTDKQLNKIVEMVACSFIYNVDMKTGTPQEQRLLKNIYCILTGGENPEEQR